MSTPPGDWPHCIQSAQCSIITCNCDQLTNGIHLAERSTGVRCGSTAVIRPSCALGLLYLQQRKSAAALPDGSFMPQADHSSIPTSATSDMSLLGSGHPLTMTGAPARAQS